MADVKVGDKVIANRNSNDRYIKFGHMYMVEKLYYTNSGTEVMVYGLKFPLSYFDPFDKKVLTKFHSGDIVIGNKYAAKYNITKPGVLCVVEDDYNTDSEFEVCVLEGPEAGKVFEVDKWCFDLANNTSDEEFRSIMFQR